MAHSRIFKWQLDVVPRQLIQCPVGTRLASVGTQNGFPVVWGLVPAHERGDLVKHESRIIRGVTTGDELNTDGCTFLGTATLEDWFVFHIFEQREGSSDPVDHRNRADWNEIRDQQAGREAG